MDVLPQFTYLIKISMVEKLFGQCQELINFKLPSKTNSSEMLTCLANHTFKDEDSCEIKPTYVINWEFFNA